MAGSAISRMPPKAVSGWFVAGTNGQLWGIITIAYFRPEAAVRLPFIECLLIDIGTQWEACVRLRPDAGALGHPPSNQACRKRRDGI